MKFMNKANARERIGISLLLLALFVATAPGAHAGPRAVKPAAQPASVIAHLPLGGASVNQMFLREQDGVQYLYLGEASKDGVAIVDVTKADQPSIVKRMAWPNERSSGNLQLVGDRLVLAETPERAGAAASAISPTKTVSLLDLSDPANPRTIQTFSGVTGTLADEARNLVYITNGDGLWILMHQPEQSAASRLHGCRTDDAFNEIAGCQ